MPFCLNKDLDPKYLNIYFCIILFKLFYLLYLTLFYVECSGCGVQRGSSVSECTNKPCGTLISGGFPVQYKTNEKKTWTISVEDQTFIELTFDEFDVYEHPLSSCTKDYVDVIDYDLTGHERLIGRSENC